MKDLTSLDRVRYAHRGLHDNVEIPENSLIAFDNAISHGYGIEFDVYLTDDHHLIVHHDFRLKRTTGLDDNAYKVDCTHLDEYKLYGTAHSIPLLSDMLSLVDGKVPLILEIKTTRKIKATCTAIYEMIKGYKGFVCIESFNPFIVKWWLRHHSEYVIGQLMGDNRSTDNLVKMMHMGNKVDFIAPSCALLNSKYLKKMKANHPNIKIICWTVKTKSNLVNAIKYADNFIFEYNKKNKEYITLDDVNATLDNK